MDQIIGQGYDTKNGQRYDSRIRPSGTNQTLTKGNDDDVKMKFEILNFKSYTHDGD